MNYVTYSRVSTKRQGQSGLGLEAQAVSIAQFIKTNGGTVVAQFVEVESGKRATRPEMAKALELCKRHGHTLLVPKLDRLARNLHFVTSLQASGIQFVAIDNPHATKFVIHILCAVAEQEALATSQRVTAALAQARIRLEAQGRKLGNPRLDVARPNAIKAVQEQKATFAASVIKAIREVQSAGVTSLNRIAECLSKRGERTARGSTVWTATAVKRVLAAAKT